MNLIKSFFKQDIKLAFINLLKLPGFSFTVIATLSLTLAALAVVLNINYLVLSKPLPYPNADNLITTDQSETINGETQYGFQILSAQFHIYNNDTVIDEMALMSLFGDRLTDLAQAPYLDGMRVTPEYFSLLRPAMHLGRYFNDNEGINDKQKVIILSYKFWQKHFKGQSDIIGQYTQLGQSRYQIIGVTSEDFVAPEVFGSFPVDAFISFDEEVSLTSNWDSITGGINGIARLKPGVSLTQANSELGPQINALYQGREGVAANTSIGAQFLPLKQKIIARSTDMALILLAGVITLLLIAISNLTNLFLSRAAQKQNVMAIQAALGAQAKHVFMSMFAEALILCLTACLFGLILAGWIMVWLDADLQYMFTRLQRLELDEITIFISAFISLIIAFIMAWIGAKQVDYSQLNNHLHSSGKGTGAQISHFTRNVLVASQIGFATLLLFGATSVLTPAINKLNQDIGFNSKNVHYLRVDAGSLERTQYLTLSNDIKSTLRSAAQVNDVAKTAVTPLHMGWEIYLYDAKNTMLGIFSVGYFDTNSFALLQHEFVNGTGFTPISGEQPAPAEVIVSESLAKRLFNDESAVGKVLQTEINTPLTVVGVVRDIYVPDRRSSYATERFYLPYSPARLGFKIKTTAQLKTQQVKSLLKGIDPNLSISQFSSLDELLDIRLRETQLTALLTISLILLALSLAAGGVYGVLSYSVLMRRYELGIHLSLGAHTHTVIKMVIKQNIKPVFIGVLSGCFLACITYLLNDKFWQANINLDLTSLLIALPVIMSISVLACYLPVRKVVIDDPLKALRSE